MRLSTKYLDFTIDEDAGSAQFVVTENPSPVSPKSDFWRLILDDGFYTELPVFSHMQKGKVTPTEKGLTVIYDQLISEYGDAYPIRLSIHIDIEDDLFKFTSEIENRTENVRVNECFCPLAEFTQLCGNKKDDALFMPYGLGERKQDPWGFMDSEAMIKNYYAHNEYESCYHHNYPDTATMAWFGIQSAGRFLYMAKYDPDHRRCFLTVRQTIHSKPTNLMLAIDQFPMVRPGETLTTSPIMIGLLEGDWRRGAKRYRAYAESTFYTIPKKPEWIQHMTGWQRLIMRSQWGHDFFKPEDLPEVYRIGAEHGVHSMFLFGWWKSGFDRDYPDCYAEAMDGLEENIKKVQEMGGHVILDCLASCVDAKSKFYNELGGKDAQILDINGNVPPQHYTFPGFGELRISFGSRWLVSCCSGSKIWRDELMRIVRRLHELGGDCAFVDTYGARPSIPCFNDKHDHGPRVDEEWITRTKFFKEALSYCEDNHMVLGTEWPTDAAASYAHFIHGYPNVGFEDGSDLYPAMYRYTFPEVVTTNRHVRCSEGHFARQFKGAITAGLRLDAELYVCRATVDRDPKYAEMVKWYTDKLTEYAEFFMDGTYTVLDDRPFPKHMKRGEFISRDGSRVLRVLFNGSSHDETLYGVKLDPEEVRFDVFDLDTYLKMPGITR